MEQWSQFIAILSFNLKYEHRIRPNYHLLVLTDLDSKIFLYIFEEHN